VTIDYAFGGRIALDFTWTLRYRAIAPTELLATSAALAQWMHRAFMTELPTCDEPLLEQAKVLREAIYRAALATSSGDMPARLDVRTLNAWAAEPSTYPQLDDSGALVTSSDPRFAGRFGVAAIARDAVQVLAVRDGRIRQCQGPWCSLLFYDSSRPGSRRWCSTDRCGNKVNTKAYRDRQRDS
jgi:predicted RNA-binding Zn ribbon-like protein